MNRLLPSLASVAAVFSLASSHAATVVSVTGYDGTTGSSDNLALSTSWTSTIGYTGVNITANLAGFGGGSTVAYLTTKVGSGTTVADQVATVTLSLSPAMTTVTLFNDLSLAAGTHYLTIRNSGGVDTMWAIGTAVATGSGVTSAPALYGGPIGAYAPASSNTALGHQLVYTVTGTAVPEPSAIGIALAGATLLGMRRRVG